MKIIGILLSLVFGIIMINSLGAKREQQELIMANISFEEKLKEILILTENKYNSPNQNFGINFSHEQLVLFQLVKRTLLENSVNSEFGYGIHLSFDDSFTETKGELERFRNTDFTGNFELHVWDGIVTYQFDLKRDSEQIIEITKRIVEEVYLKDLTRIEIDEFEI